MNFPEVGTGKFKPFDILAKQFATVAESYKLATTQEQRKELLAVMRLILDEADALHRITTADLLNQKSDPS